MRHSVLWFSISLWATIITLIFILAGCATNPTTGAVMPLPSIECKGKGVITGTGNVAVMMGSASNNFTLQADCGDLGFVFKQVAAEAQK